MYLETIFVDLALNNCEARYYDHHNTMGGKATSTFSSEQYMNKLSNLLGMNTKLKKIYMTTSLLQQIQAEFATAN